MTERGLASYTAAMAERLADATRHREQLAELAGRAAADLRAVAECARHVEPVRAGIAAMRLERAAQRFGLSDFDLDILALAALPHEHEAAAAVLAQLHPRSEAAAWTGLVAQLLIADPSERAALRATLTGGSLLSSGLLHVGAEPFAQRSIGLTSGVWEALHGLDPVPSGSGAVPGLARWLGSDPVRVAVTLLERRDVTIHFAADDLDEGVARAAALARASGRSPRVLDAAGADVAGELLCCCLRGEVPIVRHDGTAAAVLDPAQALIAVATPGTPVPVGERILVALTAPPPDIAERTALWHDVLPDDPAAARRLAGVHRIGALPAARAARDATALAQARGVPVTGERVAGHIRGRAAQALPAAARLVTPEVGWADVVLPADERAVLDAAAWRARDQALVLRGWGLGRRGGSAGVRLLFTGPPGTGKTLAAEALAGELGLDLLVVDLAALVSRWLGETEKNLAAVFDAADRSPSVLFFDEADALFARRTEVGDARDRWANLETSYLLGRLERFEGIAVLASNLRANIDEAFIRRLEFVVEFAEPAPAERERLWQGHLPASVPRTDDVQLRELARLYPVNGAVIRSAAMAAAFLASADGGAVCQDHLLTAVRREYEKAGRSFPGVPRRAEARAR